MERDASFYVFSFHDKSTFEFYLQRGRGVPNPSKKGLLDENIVWKKALASGSLLKVSAPDNREYFHALHKTKVDLTLTLTLTPILTPNPYPTPTPNPNPNHAIGSYPGCERALLIDLPRVQDIHPHRRCHRRRGQQRPVPLRVQSSDGGREATARC